MKQGEAVGRRITTRGEPERSGHVAGDLYELWRGGARDGVDSATSPVLGSGKGMAVEVEDVAAELWAGWLGRRRGGAAGRARRSTAELAEAMAEGNVALWVSGRRV